MAVAQNIAVNLLPLLAILSAWAIGIFFVAAAWPRARSLRGDVALVLPLGWGVGVGITSATFYFVSRFGGAAVGMEIAIELLMAAGCAIGLIRKRGSRPAPPSGDAGWQPPIWLGAAIVVQAVVLAAVIVGRKYATSPHGTWDGWAIWNMHARMIHRGGSDWGQLFAAPQLAWTHLDYPLLIPASVARGWAMTGTETTLVPALLSIGFGAACVALLAATAARLCGTLAGCLAALTLLSTPFFVTFSAEQHADIPLAFYLLGVLACVLIARPGAGDEMPALCLLGGLAAGFAAWTKNEGLLIVVVIVGSVMAGRRGQWWRRGQLAMLGGAALALVPVVAFKLSDAPSNDIISSALAQRWPQLFDPARHAAILAALGRDVVTFGEWRIPPYLPMLAISAVLGFRRPSRDEQLVPIVIAGVLAGYYLVYLATPWDLAWHLDTSLVRLLLHLWPTAILGWCLCTRPWVAPRRMDAPKRRVPLVAFVGANAFIAALLLLGLQRQLATDELDAETIANRAVRAVVGEGWYAREQHRRDLWVWSTGASSLEIRANRVPVDVGLRFALRGLEPQIVTIAVGEKTLWHGEAKESLAPIEIPRVELRHPRTSVRFQSTASGKLESDAPHARRLTFAIYNLEIVEPR